jgi:predicted enzyme related to lactoylglutathione lyase
MPPTVANGKICYSQIPSSDPERDCNFHKQVFHWEIRRRDGGKIAFSGSTGEVSPSWTLGRPPSGTRGLWIYSMVDSVAARIDLVRSNSLEIIEPSGANSPESTARFRDLSGNVLGLYQEPS